MGNAMSSSNHECHHCGQHPAAPATGCENHTHDMARNVYDAWAEFKGIKTKCDYIPESPTTDPDAFVQDVKSVFGVVG